MQSKNSQVFAGSTSPAFTGTMDAFVRTAKRVNVNRVPGFTRLQQSSGKVLTKLSLVFKNYSDDAVKSKPFKAALNTVFNKARLVVGYCTAAITGAVVYVSNLGDEVKGRLRANIKPVSLVKDIVSKGAAKIKDMNRADFAALQRMDGPGALDVTQKAIDGAAKATNVDLSGSIKKLFTHLFPNK